MKLLAIDGNSIVNRAFFGIKVLTTSDGQYTNAIYGFLNILQRLERETSPDAVAIAFDLKSPTFRHKMYDGYKATRKGMAPELAGQIPVLKEILADLGYKMVTCEGYEADDILGTFAKKCTDSGDFCYIATGDRDSLQLACDSVSVILAQTGKNELMDVAAVEDKYRLKINQLIDLKALMGDSSDNIPGVKGVGEKTAVSLLQKFGTLDGVYENIDDPFIKKSLREKLVKDKDNAYLSKELGTICKTAPIDTDLSHYVKGGGNPDRAYEKLMKLEMVTIAQKLTGKKDADIAPKTEKTLEKADIADYDGTMKKCVVCENDDSFILVWDKKVQRLYKNDVLGSTREFFEAKDIEKIAYDSKSLFRFCFENGIDAENISFSINLAAYLYNPLASGYEMEFIASSNGIEKAFECEDKKATLAQPVYEFLKEKIESEGMHSLMYDIELPLSEVLANMEYIGFAVDREGITEFGEMLRDKISRIQSQIFEMAGGEFNLNSPKQLGTVLFEKLNLPAGKKTKTGYSTNAETLESLRRYHPIIDLILEYRTYQKLSSTYVDGLLSKIARDGRIHSTFNQTEARTGRISSSEPNLQNIPVRTKLGSEMRKFFVAKRGCELLDADYSQIELRILAHMSDDETMKSAFIDGEDIHARTAARVMHLPIEMITPALRSRAKAVNFGIVYGIGAFSLSKDIGTTVKEANEFINDYFDNFKGVKKYLDGVKEFARENGYVTTMFNRKRILPEIRNSNKNVQALGERMAMNTPIQGTSADIIKIAMVKVYNRLKKEGLDSKLILQVHDELIVESPENEVEKAKNILHEEMTNRAKLSVPLKADVNTGANWYIAKG